MKRSLKIVPLFVVASVFREGEMAGIYPAWKRWGMKALTVGFLLSLLALAAHAQEASSDRPARAGPAASDGSAGPKDGARADGECGGKVPRWQLSHPDAAFVSSRPGAGLNDPLMEWPDRTPEGVLDHHALGYTYDFEGPQ